MMSGAGASFFPSPRVRGEGAERRRREAGEGGFVNRRLTRPLATLASTLSHRGERVRGAR